MSQLSTSCLRTDKRILAKMKELAQGGVRRLPEMRLLIHDFVCNVLFAGQPAPPRFDSRFWPSDRAVTNCIYSTRKKAKYVAEQQFLLLCFVTTLCIIYLIFQKLFLVIVVLILYYTKGATLKKRSISFPCVQRVYYTHIEQEVKVI